MLPRILEPEVMDTASEAEDYNAMDHSEVNRRFADDFLKVVGAQLRPKSHWTIFDSGTGTALIPIEILNRGLSAKIMAADLSQEMLIVAQANVTAAGFDDKIRLLLADCKSLKEADASYDAVISNSILHHIPEPLAALSECWRILKPGGVLFVRDLLRPASEQELNELVNQYGGPEDSLGAKMFRDSLWAALTVDEVRELAATLQIPPDSIQATSDRHWTLQIVKA